MRRSCWSLVALLVAVIGALFSLASETQPVKAADGEAHARISFAPAITEISPVLYPQSIAAGDLNHDGRADLGVVGEEYGGLCTTLDPLSLAISNKWDCTQPAGDAPEQVIFADVNGDGNLDEVTTDVDLPVTVVGFGDGHGRFPKGAGLRSGACGYASWQGAVADLNGDGIPDIVVTVLGQAGNPGCLAVFMGQGNRKFAKAQTISSGGSHPYSVAIGDLNNDGIPDLVVANFGTQSNGDYGNLAVLLGNGDGTFRKPIRHVGLHDPKLVILADFNDDRNLDVAVLDNGGNAVWIALGKGDGTFLPAARFPAGYAPISVVAADLNGDGIMDLAVSNFANPKPCYVSVLVGNGDGTFQKPAHFAVGVSPAQVVAADFNGDGKPDLATINEGSTISILLNTTPSPSPRQ